MAKIAKNWLILLPEIPGLPDRITRYDKKVRVTRVTRVSGYQSLVWTHLGNTGHFVSKHKCQLFQRYQSFYFCVYLNFMLILKTRRAKVVTKFKDKIKAAAYNSERSVL